MRAHFYIRSGTETRTTSDIFEALLLLLAAWPTAQSAQRGEEVSVPIVDKRRNAIWLVVVSMTW